MAGIGYWTPIDTTIPRRPQPIYTGGAPNPDAEQAPDWMRGTVPIDPILNPNTGRTPIAPAPDSLPSPWDNVDPEAPYPERPGYDELVSMFWNLIGRAPTDAELAFYLSPAINSNTWEARLKQSDDYANYQRYLKIGGKPKTPGGDIVTPPPGEIVDPIVIPRTMAEWKAWWEKLVTGKTPSTATFNALTPEMTKYGVVWSPSASGKLGKIKLPDGTIVDVARGAGVVNGEPTWDAWQWDFGPGGSESPNPSYNEAEFGKLRQPFGEKFDYEAWKGTEPFKWDVPDIGQFQAPTAADLQNDPGYQVRMNEGVKAVDASAAAKGNLMTGGTLRSLTRFGQEQGAKEYQNAYERAASTYGIKAAKQQSDYQKAFDTWKANTTAGKDDWTTNYTKALNEYQMRYGIWNDQQKRDFENLYRLAQLGASSASA